MAQCECGCGQESERGFLSGHDQRLQTQLEALAELDCRRTHGAKVCIFPARGIWIVGPV
jgi:hypothetical protein